MILGECFVCLFVGGGGGGGKGWLSWWWFCRCFFVCLFLEGFGVVVVVVVLVYQALWYVSIQGKELFVMASLTQLLGYFEQLFGVCFTWTLTLKIITCKYACQYIEIVLLYRLQI